MPGITAASPLDLYYFPFSHSLVASVVWLGVAAIAYRLFRPKEEPWRKGLIVGLAVLSHWVIDFLVHRPDLPLYDDTLKVDLGLWNYLVFSFLLEAGILLGGLLLYLHVTTSVTPAGRYGMHVFVMLLIVIHAGNTFGPPPPSPEAVAVLSLISSFVFTIVAYWLDRNWYWSSSARSDALLIPGRGPQSRGR